jgi:hypothetical protein
MVKSNILTKDQKDKIFIKLMKEHEGPEKVIDLRGIVSKLRRYAWLNYDARFTEEEIGERLLDYLNG